MKTVSMRTLIVSIIMVFGRVFTVLSANAVPLMSTISATAAEAVASDIDLLANETGLPREAVERAVVFQEAFARYVDVLNIRFPNQISAVWTEPVPNTRGYIQFVEDIPLDVTTEIAAYGELNSNNVVLIGHGMISMADHSRRAALAAKALRNLGYQNVLTFFDPVGQVIRIEIRVPENAAQPTLSHIAAEMQGLAKAQIKGRAATVEALDLNLTIFRGSGSIVTEQHSLGGNWLLDDGVRECTSGWSVSGAYGDGIITAGHCTGLNQFEEPGVTPYGMTLRSWIHGAGGDVEYHTTSHIEFDDFYADATNIRDVSGIRSTNTMVGNAVCVYGRASNVRTCTHTVEAVGVTIDGIGNLARVSGATTIAGDSGAGWSFDTIAWGVHYGIDGADNAYFTPVEQAQTALGLIIKAQ
jgi:hypothetical protein